jgi:hypothetical protein
MKKAKKPTTRYEEEDFSLDKKGLKRQMERKRNRNLQNAMKTKNVDRILDYYDDEG